MAETTVIKNCPNCDRKGNIHDFQDKMYGKYNRVFNISEKGTAHCTVCGQEIKYSK